MRVPIYLFVANKESGLPIGRPYQLLDVDHRIYQTSAGAYTIKPDRWGRSHETYFNIVQFNCSIRVDAELNYPTQQYGNSVVKIKPIWQLK